MRHSFRASNTLVRIFYVLLICFPCTYAFWLALCKLSIVPPRNLLLGGIYAGLLFGGCIFAAKPFRWAEGHRWYHPAVLALLLITAFLVRVWVILKFKNPPVSNYQEAQASAEFLLGQGISIFHPRPPVELSGDDMALYHCIYPSWALYMLVLKNLYALFGSSIYTAQFLNAVLTAGIMAGLYRLCARYLKRPGMGLGAAAAFGFWPVSILSCTLHTPDFFTILLMLLALLAWARAGEQEGLLRRLPWTAAAGLLLGLLNRFKSVAAVLLAALAICELVCRILPALFARRKGFPQALGGGTAVLVSAALCMAAATAGADWAIGQNIGHPPQNLTGWFFYVGLTGEDGMWTPEKQRFRDELLEEYSCDIPAVNQTLQRETLAQIRQDPGGTLGMIGEKTKTFWTDDLDLFWSMYGRTMDHHYDLIKGASRVFYMALMLFVSLGALGLLADSFLSRSAPEAVIRQDFGPPAEGPLRRENRPLFLAALFLFGLALMFLVSEMQIRYKFILGAPLSLMAGYGAYCLRLLPAALGESRRPGARRP